jgi:hypothetical protein
MLHSQACGLPTNKQLCRNSKKSGTGAVTRSQLGYSCLYPASGTLLQHPNNIKHGRYLQNHTLHPARGQFDFLTHLVQHKSPHESKAQHEVVGDLGGAPFAASTAAAALTAATASWRWGLGDTLDVGQHRTMLVSTEELQQPELQEPKQQLSL